MGAARYHHMGLLAKGGMGTVELVVRSDGTFRRLCARKRLLPTHRDDPERRAMFLEEARLAGLIRHANVVSVIDVGEDHEGPFLIMELIEGVPLSEVVRSIPDQGSLPLLSCVEIGRQIAEGLAAAHEVTGPDAVPLNLIHRDLSPSNVLVGCDGVARITDFGIAKASGQSMRTNTGVLKGKPGYMAPEQFRFETLDQQADLFSLGVVLFELLSGRRLYSGTGAGLNEVARQVLHEPPPDLAEVRPGAPDALTELLFELLAKEPADRPATAREVAQRLRGLEAELRIDEEAPSIAELMAGRFPHARAAFGARSAEALAMPESIESELDTVSLVPAASARGLKTTLLMLSAAAVIALGVGMGALEGLRPEPRSATAAPLTPLPLAAGPVPAAGASDGGTSSAPSDAAMPAPVEASAAREVLEPTARAEPAEAPRTLRRRRRVRRRRPAEAPGGGGVHTWDWQ